MTRQAEHVKQRRNRGACSREGCQEQTGPRYRCPKHALEHAARMRAIYAAKRAAKQQEAA